MKKRAGEGEEFETSVQQKPKDLKTNLNSGQTERIRRARKRGVRCGSNEVS